MKKFISIVLITLFLSFNLTAEAKGGHGGSSGSVHVQGYTKSNGTYVEPHYRSAPDGNFNNNWSTKGNTNPYTGKEGTVVNPPNNNSNGYDSNYISPQNENNSGY
jgi:hypothetical protein